MQNQDNDWFDKLYRDNYPRMVKQASYLLNDKRIAEELANEAFLIYLYKRSSLSTHPNIPGWLSQTLKNLIADELKSAKNRLEIPLDENKNISTEDVYKQSLSENLPKELSAKDREVLALFYEKQLTHAQIATYLNISELNCRARLYRAKKRYKELLQKEKNIL